MNPTLADIQDEISNVLSAFDSDHLEETGGMPPEAMAYLNQLAVAESGKIESYLRAESYAQAEIEWLKSESKRLSARAATLENALKWRRGYILRVMQSHRLKKLQGRSGSIVRQSSPEALLIGPELPDAWKKEVVTVDVQPDRERIRAALERGEDVPGAVLQAGEHVRFYRPQGK